MVDPGKHTILEPYVIFTLSLKKSPCNLISQESVFILTEAVKKWLGWPLVVCSPNFMIICSRVQKLLGAQARGYDVTINRSFLVNKLMFAVKYFLELLRDIYQIYNTEIIQFRPCVTVLDPEMENAKIWRDRAKKNKNFMLVVFTVGNYVLWTQSVRLCLIWFSE